VGERGQCPFKGSVGEGVGFLPPERMRRGGVSLTGLTGNHYFYTTYTHATLKL